jgi:hypothetical protein
MFYEEFYEPNRVWLDSATSEKVSKGAYFTEWKFLTEGSDAIFHVSHSPATVVIDFENNGKYGRFVACNFREDPTNRKLLALQYFEDWTKPTEQEKDYFEMIYGVRIPWSVDTPFVMM